MSYRGLRRPRKSLWEHACTLMRRLTWHRGPYFIVRWGKVWRYARSATLTTGKPICEVGGAGWRNWVVQHDRLMWYHPATGSILLKREVYRRKLRTGATAEYEYWRAYRWPWRRKKPTRVYVGCLERMHYESLEDRMRELKRRYDDQRRHYRAEQERRKAQRRRSAKRRWYQRYRERNRSV